MKETKQAIITHISETTCEDNMYWIGYDIGDNHGYNIVEYAEAKSYEIGAKIEVIEKPNVNICSSALLSLIMDCHTSDNEMLIVEKGEMIDCDVLEIQNEVLDLDLKYKNLELSDHITFGEDDALITIYGGVSTLFEF